MHDNAYKREDNAFQFWSFCYILQLAKTFFIFIACRAWAGKGIFVKMKMLKKYYEEAEIEVLRFECCDVLTSSGGDDTEGAGRNDVDDGGWTKP